MDKDAHAHTVIHTHTRLHAYTHEHTQVCECARAHTQRREGDPHFLVKVCDRKPLPRGE